MNSLFLPFSRATAYVLGILAFCPPFSGLLRFYLSKHGAGIVYTATAGLCWIGNILDIVKVPLLVREANIAYRYKEALRSGVVGELVAPERIATARSTEPRRGRDPVEQVILRSAKKNRGFTTPSEVALESDICIDEAKKSLDTLVSKGFAEMRVRESGVIVYRFPELIEAESTEEGL